MYQFKAFIKQKTSIPFKNDEPATHLLEIITSDD